MPHGAPAPPPSRSGAERYGNVLKLPPAGRLVVSTDLHGNLEDYHRVVAVFERELAVHGDAYLLFTGDLIHGPAYARAEWPEPLGDFYEDQSGRVVLELIALMAKHPKRVFSLIGNHEHSHVGGPPTRKFHRDPSETEFFETSVGPEKAEEYRAFFRSLPLAAVCGRGVVITHGPPRVLRATFAEIASASYGGHEKRTIKEMLTVPILGELFWSRASGRLVVRRFLKRMELGGQPNWIVVFGHDPVRKGFAREGEEQLCFSTSFALKNEKKVFLGLDLSQEYRSVHDLRVGREILHLYPEVLPERQVRKKAPSDRASRA